MAIITILKVICVLKMIDKIRNLNDLRRGDVRGLYKKWIYKTPNTYHKVCDYLQKINYSIQDLNSEIECLSKISAKEIIFIISLVDWIIESFNAIKSALKDKIIKNYSYTRSSELDKAKAYLKALRSFIVAHPLSTNRHKEFGFDGNFICIDITPSVGYLIALLNNHLEYFYHLDYEGLKEKTYDETDDFYLRSYSEKDDGMKFSREIGSKVEYIYRVADLYIDALYELDKYLSKQKKANF